MSQQTPSIPRLSELVVMAVHVSDTLEVLHKELGFRTDSVGLHISDTLVLQQRLVQGLLALQQEQDLALAIQCGEA